jgi:hypothetical protein
LFRIAGQATKVRKLKVSLVTKIETKNVTMSQCSTIFFFSIFQASFDAGLADLSAEQYDVHAVTG